MISLRRAGGLTLWAMTIGVATPALAQAPTVQNGLPTREEVNRAQPPGGLAEKPSRLTVEGGVERAPCPLADPRFADIKVTLTKAEFENLKVVSPELLRPAYESYLGKEEPIAVVCEIRDAAATILRGRGYLAAVQVPAQKIEGGVVRFTVLMAKIVAIQVRGNAGKSERTIAGYLDALKSQPVFNEREAERYLLLARDLPGYEVRMTLRPAGTAPGEVIGEVAVARIPFSIDANVQNYGSHQVGRFGALLRGETYDLLGFGDRFTAGFYATPQFQEQHVVQLGYDARVGAEGLTFGGRFTYAWTRPDLGATANANGRIKSRTLVSGLEASFPLIRSQATNMRLAGGFELIEQRTYLDSKTGPRLKANRDKIRVFYARADADLIDPRSFNSVRGFSAGEPHWRLGSSLELRKGISGLGASDDCGPGPLYARCSVNGVVPLSRAAAKPDAFVARLTATAEYRPIPNITFSLAPRAQYSPDSLVSYEQYSGGNFTIGRAYDPGVVIGDSGIGFSAEARFGTLSPRSRSAVTVQPFLFYDRAWTWTHVDAVPAPGSKVPRPDPQELESAGFGARMAWGDHARLEATLAVPTRSAGLQTRRGDTRFLISFSTKLFPWNR